MSIHSSHAALVAANHAAIDGFLALFTTSLNSIEKISSHNFSSARHALAVHREDSGSLPGAGGLPEVIAHQASLVRPRIEKAITYSQGIYGISTETQKELVKLIERQHAELNKSITSLVDWYADAASNSQTAFALVESALAAASSAFQNTGKAARQVAGIAGTSLSAAAQAAGAANQQGQASPRKKAA
ncbi:MAG: phasin family protein [Bacteroidota bacterium]